MKFIFSKHTKLILTTLTLTLSTLFALPIMATAAEIGNDYTDEEYYEGTMTIESPNTINNVDEFNVYGTASYKGGAVPANSHIFLEIVNKDEAKPYIREIQLFGLIINGEYLFSSIRIPSGYADDIYLIRVYLVDDDTSEIIGFNEKEVVLINQ